MNDWQKNLFSFQSVIWTKLKFSWEMPWNSIPYPEYKNKTKKPIFQLLLKSISCLVPKENDACNVQWGRGSQRQSPTRTAVNPSNGGSRMPWVRSFQATLHIQKTERPTICSTLLYSSNTSSVVFKIFLTKVSGV